MENNMNEKNEKLLFELKQELREQMLCCECCGYRNSLECFESCCVFACIKDIEKRIKHLLEY